MSSVMKGALVAVVAIAALSAGFFVRQDGRHTVKLPADAQSVNQFMTTSLPDLQGKRRQLTDWKGKVVVVNFWATWCAPCREEIPALVRTQAQFEGKGVQIIGIALDELARVKPFSVEMGINYPVLLTGVEGLDLARAAGNEVGALPFTVYLDRKGNIVKAELGGVSESTLAETLKPLL